MQLLWGIGLHGIGAFCAAICYVPQKKVMGWSWQTFWLAQAAVCWLILPVLVAILTIPQLGQVLSEAPLKPMVQSFTLGMAYGVGGTAFGMAIRYVGFSLTYAIAVGLSCVLGTLIPPLVDGNLNHYLGQNGAGWIFGGLAFGALGIGISGAAGKMKERELRVNAVNGQYQFTKGILLCLLAGFLSAMYGFAINRGAPLADIAEKYGAGHLKGNVIYIFSNTGAFLVTFIYCAFLHYKKKTWSEYRVKALATNGSVGILTKAFLLASLTGTLWYAQFFFYGLGHVRMAKYEFTSWGIHMIMLVLFSALTGLLLREWKICRPATRWVLGLGLLVLVSAVCMLTYGNYLGEG